jgi:hypothetical protein
MINLRLDDPAWDLAIIAQVFATWFLTAILVAALAAAVISFGRVTKPKPAGSQLSTKQRDLRASPHKSDSF